jgi:predicted type IV restriction endonuclease
MDNNFVKKLQKYQKNVEDWFKFIEDKKGTEFNKEENTKIKFVVPLLDILGWDSLVGYDVEFEHHIPKVKGRDAADIALYTSFKKLAKPVILIEVKPIQDTIREDIPTKIFEYMTHAKIPFGIATNGKQLLLFDNYRTRHDSVKGCNLLNFRSVKDLIDYSDVLNLLSKEMVSKDRLNQFSAHFHKYSFFSWRESRKTNKKDHDEYTLRLEFARNFLKCSKSL